MSRSSYRRGPAIHIVAIAAALVLSMVAHAQPVRAATIIVDSLADPSESGKTTLRDALAAANDSDTITFSVTGTITASAGPFTIDDDITIDGPGADQLTLSAGPARVVSVNGGVTASISGVTITGASLAGLSGAGISSAGNLTLSHVVVSNNATDMFGGGIFSGTGALVIEHSTISGNSAAHAGAINVNGGSLTLRNSTVSGNATTFASGTILIQGDAPGKLLVENSTISGNTGLGAGLSLQTVSSQGFPTELSGTLRNSTVANNALIGVSISAVSNDSEQASVTLHIGSTIVAGNAIDFSQSTTTGTASATLNSGGRNLTSDATGPTSGTGDMIETDPLLEALANNGGPTETHALGENSPAIDQGENLSFADYDQRGPGYSRFSNDPTVSNAGDGTDIGAFEVQFGADDITPPVTDNVFVGLRAARADNVPLLVEWSSADDETADGDLFHEVQTRRQLAGGGFSPWSTRTTVTGVEQAPINIAFNRTVQFRVRSTDLAGNTSAWTSPVSFLGKQRPSTYFTRNGPWTKVTTSAWGGSAHRGATGATATRSFNGKAVGLVMRAAATQGSAEICLDKGTVGEVCVIVNLGTFTPRGNRQLVVAFDGLAPGLHTVSVEVLGGPVQLVGAIIGR